jgi:hypothetical protein
MLIGRSLPSGREMILDRGEDEEAGWRGRRERRERTRLQRRGAEALRYAEA